MAPHDVGEIARALEAEGTDALSLINTIPAMAIDVRTRRSRLSRPTAGLSGPAIHLRARLGYADGGWCSQPPCRRYHGR